MTFLEKIRGKSWLKWVGYSLFYNVVFYGAVYFTFPYDALRDRITSEVRDRTGMQLSIGKVRLAGLSGVTLKDVRILTGGEAHSYASAAEIAKRTEEGTADSDREAKDRARKEEEQKMAESGDAEALKKKLAQQDSEKTAELARMEGGEKAEMARKIEAEREEKRKAEGEKKDDARSAKRDRAKKDREAADLKMELARKEAESAKGAQTDAPAPPSLGGIHVDSVTAKVDLLSALRGNQAITFDIDAWGGSITGRIAQGEKTQAFRMSAKNLQLAQSPLHSLAGLDIEGRLASLEIELVAEGPDFTKADGHVVIKGEDLLLKGGEVQQFELPKVVLGTLDGKLDIKEGKADTDTFELKGEDIDAKLAATIRLAPQFLSSTITGKLQLKPSEDWWNRNEMLKAAAGFALPAGNDGWRSLNVYGQLQRPNFRP